MKAFHFKQGTDTWPAGETLLHVYALPDLRQDRALRELVRGCRQATAGYPLTFVEEQWLHITIAQITDTVGRLVPDGPRRELATELQHQLRRIAPFDIQVGSCLSYSSGLIYDVHPDDQLAELHDAVHSVVERVRGPEATRYDTGVLHLSLAYANNDADSDEIQRKLRRVRPSHATMTIGSVHLLDVAADPEAKSITWAAPQSHQQLLLGTTAP